MITGFYFRTLFRDEKDGYTVFLLSTDTGTVSLCGHIPPYLPWTPLRISEETDASGRLHVRSVTESSAGLPADKTDRFLKECGLTDPAHRSAVLNLLPGRDLFDLADTPGFIRAADRILGKEASTSLRKQILLPRYQRTFHEYLTKLIGRSATPRYYLINRYAEDLRGAAVPHFHMHLYQVCSDRLGIPFEEADRIARKLGIRHPEERIKSLGTALLNRARQSGSTCLPADALVADVCKALYEADGTETAPSDASRLLKCSSSLIVEESSGVIALQADYQAEKIAADGIRSMLNAEKSLFTEEELEETLNNLSESLGLTYAPGQRKAFRLLLHTGPAILTGGPGTGKTTTLNGIIRAYSRKYPSGKVILASPTGRAAQRMSESTGLPASTIHRLAETGSGKAGDAHIDADLLVIDESSMLDTEMLSWIFGAVRPDALVLLVGDTDQLPSVGPGDVLHSLICCGRIPVCRLETVYRQQGESLIVRNAGLINSGISLLSQDETFRVTECPEDTDIPEKVRDSVLEAVKANPDPLETQVLCTAYKGVSGIDRLNRMLQELLNPVKPGGHTLKFGNTEFRLNDKVITTSNNYALGFFNGDIGTVTAVSPGELTVQILDREIRIPARELRNVSLAYCISIHKSQGSEFRNVIIALPGAPRSMLKRNLLYTAVTRARSRCTIIARIGAVRQCCTNAELGVRATQLQNRICS